MKALLLLFLYMPVFIFGQNSLNFNYGVSYPDGISSRLNFKGYEIDSSIGLNYVDDELAVNRFYFETDLLSIGHLVPEGLLRDIKKENYHFFSFGNPTRFVVKKDGDPQLNRGVDINIRPLCSAVSVLRDDSFTRILLSGNFELPYSLTLSLIQVLTAHDSQSVIETWYMRKPVIYSPFQSNSSLTLLLGSKDLFCGTQLQVNIAPEDPAGMSLFFMGGYKGRKLFFQNEIRYNSERFTTVEMDISDYSLLVKGKIDYLLLPLCIKNSYYFSLGRYTLPWENPLWKFNMHTELQYRVENWRCEGNLEFSLYNSVSDDFLFSAALNGELERQYKFLFWQIQGCAEFDEIYIYSLSLKGGYKSDDLEFSLSPVLNIDKRVRLNLFLDGKITFNNCNLTAAFSLEDIGLYNIGSVKLKPSFFIGMDWEQISFFPEKTAAKQQP